MRCLAWQAAKREAAARPAAPSLDPEEAAQLEVLVEKARLMLVLAEPAAPPDAT